MNGESFMVGDGTPRGRLRTFWHGLLKPRPVDVLAEAARSSEKMDPHVERAFERARSAVERAEATAHATPSRVADAPRALEEACASMEQTIHDLREACAAGRSTPSTSAAPVARKVEEAWRSIAWLETEVAALAKRRDEAGRDGEAWERRAMEAVRAGSDELAREALDMRRHWVALERSLAREHDVTVRIVAAFREALGALGFEPPSSKARRR